MLTADGKGALLVSMTTQLDKAINLAGGAPELARRIKVSKQAIYLWRRGSNVGAEYVLPIVRAVRGAVTPHDLRPDLYPDAQWLPDLGEDAA